MKASKFIQSLYPRLRYEVSNTPMAISLCLGGFISLTGFASAATQYWDPGLTPTANAGKGSGGSGTWDAATANWTDGTVDATFVSAPTPNVAGFAGAAGTVGLTTGVTTGGISLEESGYILGNATALSQVFVSSQATTDVFGIVVGSGVTGTTIDLGSVKLGSSGSGVSIWLYNTDLVDFKNTGIILTGSRTTKITNSSTSATTTFAKLATSDKSAGGTWPNAQVHLQTGNLTINSLAAGSSVVAASNGAPGTFGGNAATASFPTVFAGTSTGTLTINGDNTLYTNAVAGQGPIIFTFNMSAGTLALGHDNALGSRNATSVLTNNTLQMSSGTVIAAGGARNIENKLIINGTTAIGGSNNITFTNDVTNNGGNRTLNVNNTGVTTFSGSAYLANDDATARTLTIGGTSNTTISGAITNNNAGNTLASNLTKSGTGTLTLGGANTYTGNTTINSGSTLTLASTGSLKFVIQPAALTNKITGAGSANLNGTFNINLANAGTPAIGDKWTLVDSSFSFGSTFSVAAPFAETSVGSGLWSYNDGTNTWYFSKLSGKLSYGVTPELVWDGDSGGAWSVGGNWFGGAAPVSGDTLVFAGSNTTNNNDLSTETLGTVALGGIIFSPTANSFSLNGNPVNLAGKSITNLSASSQTLATDIEADTGFSVNTSAGDVTLTGSLKTTTGFNKPLNKSGTGTLILNGIQNTSWALNVNAGTMQVFNPNTASQVTAYTATIASGATLKAESGDILHFSLDLTNNGTFDVSAAGESFGSLLGTGVVTNHGASSAVTCTLSLGSGNSNFSGSIQNGPLGAPTAINLFDQNTVDVEYYTHTFSGTNTYTGDTTIAQQDVSFVLASTGSLVFKPGANGENNKIAGVAQSANGTVTLDGTFNIDLTGAAINNGNSWQIVGAALIPTTTFGDNFNIPGFTEAPENPGVWQKSAGSNTWTFREDDGTLSLAVTGGAGYGSWITDFGLPPGDQDPTDDPDSDGFDNLLEYVLGGNPALANTSIAPTGEKSGADFILSFTRSVQSEGDVITSVQYGNDLVGWTTVAVPAAGGSVSGLTFSVTPNTPSPGIDKVVATIPNGAASKFFARVKAAD